MASTFFQQAAMKARGVSKPAFHWQPEEDAKLMELIAGGKSWEEISIAIPGRSAMSCARHYRQTLARKIVRIPKSNEIIRAYNRKKAQVWKGIAEEVSLPWQEVETIFFYHYQERPDIIETEKTISLPSHKPQEERRGRAPLAYMEPEMAQTPQEQRVEGDGLNPTRRKKRRRMEIVELDSSSDDE